MKIAIVSDIHDHLKLLLQALDRAKQEGAEVLFCCGDLCSPFIMHALGKNFAGAIHIALGNNEGDRVRMVQVAQLYPQIHIYPEICSLTLGGKRIGMVHSDELGRPLAESGLYDVVFFGHNHRQEMGEKWVNPGELCGELSGKSTFSVMDLASLKAVTIEL